MSNKESPLAASQRLLDYISSGTKKAGRQTAAEQKAALPSDAGKPPLFVRLAEAAKNFSRRMFSIAGGSETRDRIGISFGLGGIMLVRASRSGRVPCIEDVRFYPLPKEKQADLNEGLTYLGEELGKYLSDRRFRRQKPFVNMYLPLEVSSQNFIFELPEGLKAQERDSVALLTALQTKPFDAASCYFDYRPASPKGADASGNRRYFGFSAPRTEVDQFRDSLIRAGIPIHGVTSRIFAQVGIFGSDWLPGCIWKDYVIISVVQHLTVVAVVVDHVPVEQRLLHVGMNDIGQEIRRQKNADVFDLSYLTGDAEPLSPDILKLMSSEHLSDEDREWLRGVLESTLDRISNFALRVAGFHELQGVYVTAAGAVGQLLAETVRGRKGLPCQVVGPDGPKSPAAAAAIAELNSQGYAGLVFEAMALTLANEFVPDILELPAVRRRRAKEHLWVSWACFIFTVIGLAAGSAAAVGGLEFMKLRSDTQALESELKRYQPRFSAADVRSELARIASLRTEADHLVGRRRLAAVVSELGPLRRDGMYISEIRLEPRTLQPEKGKGTSKTENTLIIRGTIEGSRVSREIALTEFLRELRTHPVLGTSPVLQKGKTTADMMEFTVTLGGL